MIKFFRKIRQQLLTQKKFSKYLIYAIGEIVLVVIGILIALSVNNWNEGRLLKIEEMNFLVILDKALYLDEGDLRGNDYLTKRTLSSYTIIKNQLLSDLPYHDSLAIHFGYCFDVTNLINNPSNLKTLGLDKISNEELKSKIIKYYDYDIPHLLKIEKEWLNQHFNLRVVPFLIKNFNYSGLYHTASPKNYENLKNDTEFIALLNTTQSIFELKQMVSTIAYETAIEIRMEISDEFKKNNWVYLEPEKMNTQTKDFTVEFEKLK